jgi:hypothetical protein
LSASSVGYHAANGGWAGDDIAIPIDLVDGTNEPRVQGGGQLTIEMQFSGDLSAMPLATVAPDPGPSYAVSAGGTPSQAILSFDADVAKGSYTVTLSGSATGEIKICYIEGDVNDDGVTTGGDMAEVQAGANWLLDLSVAADARADVNRDGAVTGGDMSEIQKGANWLLPDPPATCQNP